MKNKIGPNNICKKEKCKKKVIDEWIGHKGGTAHGDLQNQDMWMFWQLCEHQHIQLSETDSYGKKLDIEDIEHSISLAMASAGRG